MTGHQKNKIWRALKIGIILFFLTKIVWTELELVVRINDLLFELLLLIFTFPKVVKLIQWNFIFIFP